MNKAIVLTLLTLFGVTLLFEVSSLDIWVQHFFFKEQKWLLSFFDYPNLKLFLYNGLKTFTIVCALITLLLYLLSFFESKLLSFHKKLLIAVLGFIFIPLTVGLLKQVTNIYCPYELSMFTGSYPYAKLFESYPKELILNATGKCFPAGHATSGFAFLALMSFHKRFFLLFGTSAGFIAGFYQMARGAHFLSHTLTSFLLALLIVFLLQKYVDA